MRFHLKWNWITDDIIFTWLLSLLDSETPTHFVQAYLVFAKIMDIILGLEGQMTAEMFDLVHFLDF